MRSNSPLLVRMELKAGLALLMLLLIPSFGITDAVRQRTEDVSVSNPPPLSTDTGKHFLRADSSLKIGSIISGVAYSPRMKVKASGKAVVRRLIGSLAPECGHTCGACSPCEIQVVSFECSEALEQHAEACPLGYSCLCHGRSFPIP